MSLHGRSSRVRHHTSSLALIVGIIAAIVAVLVVGTITARRRGYSGIGGNTIVRCRRGHLFTTIWVPGASVKALRLGWWRFQYCPVGKHWTLVRPVNETTLSDEQKRAAGHARDIRMP
jgi:hypothetical protein